MDWATCASYAQGAVSAANEVRGLGCEFDLSHPQWSTNYDDHFQWCRSLGLSQSALDEEINNRAAQLNNCRVCAAYAVDATDNVKKINKVRACMKPPSDPRWSPDPAVHRRWCLQAKTDSVNAEQDARDREALKCSTCDDYAKKALSEIDRIKQCGGKVPSGARWSPNYTDHFFWCMGLSYSYTSDPTRSESSDRRSEASRLCIAKSTQQGLSKGTEASVPRRKAPEPTRTKPKAGSTTSDTARALNPCQPGHRNDPCKPNPGTLTPGLLEGGGGFSSQGPAATGTPLGGGSPSGGSTYRLH